MENMKKWVGRGQKVPQWETARKVVDTFWEFPVGFFFFSFLAPKRLEKRPRSDNDILLLDFFKRGKEVAQWLYSDDYYIISSPHPPFGKENGKRLFGNRICCCVVGNHGIFAQGLCVQHYPLSFSVLYLEVGGTLT
jgi:hypothetical protein